MELLTIGAFACASGLSPKALRLYAELELLSPVEVDPHTGYRRDARGQLGRARLVLWCRRLGMPLATIRDVADRPVGDRAAVVAAYWAGVEAATASRRASATSLLAHLRQEAGEMTEKNRRPAPVPDWRSAAAADPGQQRAAQHDVAYARADLLAVADGFGPAGAAAAGAAVDALITHRGPGAVLARLQDATLRAEQSVLDRLAGCGTDGETSGTTLTALAVDGADLALVHVGDGRAYLLRDGELIRLSADHTHVQQLLDEGRLTQEEAVAHPDRLTLVRALHVDAPSRADSAGLRARTGDRYLLVTGGVHRVLDEQTVRDVLVDAHDPDAAVAELVRRVRAAGAPDNLGCAVIDAVIDTAIDTAIDPGAGS